MTLVTACTLVVCASLASCAASGVRVTDAQLSSLQVGVTTEADVQSRFGAPTARTRNSNGTVQLQYIYAESQIRAASFIPVVGLFAGGSDIKSTMAVLTFGPDGKLKDSWASSSQFGTGIGISAGQISPGNIQQPRQ